MSPLDLAKKYMDILFSGSNPDQLEPLFGDKFLFEGPFYTFHTARNYIDSLKSGPPENFSYHILSSWSNDSSACLIYQFSKPGISTPMAQWFEVKNNKIIRILLIFDSKPFVSNMIKNDKDP